MMATLDNHRINVSFLLEIFDEHEINADDKIEFLTLFASGELSLCEPKTPEEIRDIVNLLINLVTSENDNEDLKVKYKEFFEYFIEYFHDKIPLFQHFFELSNEKSLVVMDTLESVPESVLINLSANKSLLKYINKILIKCPYIVSKCENVLPKRPDTYVDCLQLANISLTEQKLIVKTLNLLNRIYQYSSNLSQFHLTVFASVIPLAYLGNNIERSISLKILQNAVNNNLIPFIMENYMSEWAYFKTKLLNVFYTRMVFLKRNRHIDWQTQWCLTVKILMNSLIENVGMLVQLFTDRDGPKNGSIYCFSRVIYDLWKELFNCTMMESILNCLTPAVFSCTVIEVQFVLKKLISETLNILLQSIDLRKKFIEFFSDVFKKFYLKVSDAPSMVIYKLWRELADIIIIYLSGKCEHNKNKKNGIENSEMIDNADDEKDKRIIFQIIPNFIVYPITNHVWSEIIEMNALVTSWKILYKQFHLYSCSFDKNNNDVGDTISELLTKNLRIHKQCSNVVIHFIDIVVETFDYEYLMLTYDNKSIPLILNLIWNIIKYNIFDIYTDELEKSIELLNIFLNNIIIYINNNDQYNNSNNIIKFLTIFHKKLIILFDLVKINDNVDNNKIIRLWKYICKIIKINQRYLTNDFLYSYKNIFYYALNHNNYYIKNLTIILLSSSEIKGTEYRLFFKNVLKNKLIKIEHDEEDLNLDSNYLNDSDDNFINVTSNSIDCDNNVLIDEIPININEINQNNKNNNDNDLEDPLNIDQQPSTSSSAKKRNKFKRKKFNDLRVTFTSDKNTLKSPKTVQVIPKSKLTDDIITNESESPLTDNYKFLLNNIKEEVIENTSEDVDVDVEGDSDGDEVRLTTEILATDNETEVIAIDNNLQQRKSPRKRRSRKVLNTYTRRKLSRNKKTIKNISWSDFSDIDEYLDDTPKTISKVTPPTQPNEDETAVSTTTTTTTTTSTSAWNLTPVNLNKSNVDSEVKLKQVSVSLERLSDNKIKKMTKIKKVNDYLPIDFSDACQDVNENDPEIISSTPKRANSPSVLPPFKKIKLDKTFDENTKRSLRPREKIKDSSNSISTPDDDFDDPIYPELVDVKQPITNIINNLVNHLWCNKLKNHFISINVNTIGDLAAMPWSRVGEIPLIKNPKAPFVKSVLDNYYKSTLTDDKDSTINVTSSTMINRFEQVLNAANKEKSKTKRSLNRSYSKPSSSRSAAYNSSVDFSLNSQSFEIKSLEQLMDTICPSVLLKSIMKKWQLENILDEYKKNVDTKKFNSEMEKIICQTYTPAEVYEMLGKVLPIK